MKYGMDDAINQYMHNLEKKVEWYGKKYGPYIEKRGLRNWRNLFRKPTLHEWVILFMLVMVFFTAWAYNADTAQCRETLNNITGICLSYCIGQDNQSSQQYLNFSEINLSRIIIKAENSSLDET